jgi:hypothetical protein
VSALDDEYRRIAAANRAATRHFTARSCIPASVTRVFATGTKAALLPVLAAIPVDELPRLAGEAAFRAWFERQLEVVSAVILRLNPPEVRPGIHPGYKWGHASKVLALYLRDLVLSSRDFPDADAERIAFWLYCPVDSIVMKRMRELGEQPGVYLISGIDSPRKFWHVQDTLAAAAARAGAPRVWFDDNWGDRERDAG